MNQHSDPYSANPPSIAAPAQNMAPARPQVVHVVAKPGGFWRAASIIAGLFLFGAVFIIGLTLGIIVMVAGASMDNMVVRQTYRDGGFAASNKIAVIPVEGVIDNAQAEFVHAAVEDVLDDTAVKAVVLRVDSPGGGVTASDEIWYEIKRLRDNGLPVVASFGGVAASGGYYISCGADHIIAQETCMTGSIGVIAQILTMEELMNKVGVQPITLVASGSPQKNVANDIFRAWNDQDKAKIMTMLNAAYATFSQRVRDGRNGVIQEPQQLEAVANGSIFTAQEALENGLIDSIGYLDDAISVAETQAKLTTGAATVEILRKPPTFMGAMMGAQAGASFTGSPASLDADAIRNLVNDLASPRVMYLMH